MPLSYPHEPTTLIDPIVVTIGLILALCPYSPGQYAHKYAGMIPTDPQPLVSLAAGLGGWAGNTTDKEESV